MSSDRLKTRVGINVVEKIISLKVQDQEFFTTKSLSVYLGGVSKDFIKDLRDRGELPYYKVRKTIFYKISDVKRLIENNRMA